MRLAVALWCAALVAARATAYTVDCNHEYTDCDSELSKLANEDEETQSSSKTTPTPPRSTSAATITTEPTILTPKIDTPTEPNIEVTTKQPETTEAAESAKPEPRLLNLNDDYLQSFANALHNQTQENGEKKGMTDLSDVNLDDDDDEPPRTVDHHKSHDKSISDKFYTNLQAPFNPMMTMDRGSEEIDILTCKEDKISYKIGERIDRGCDEVCECYPGGVFDCTPRCKHPYIRRGRRLNDPLCFESPIDECCSIIACATGNGENTKVKKVEVCRYGNETYAVGSKWNIDCEQQCSCEANSVITCRPRCNPLPQNDKCINVQDPNDECCEVQICDVSQDAHEEPENVTSSTSTTTTTTSSSIESLRETDDFRNLQTQQLSTMRPLVLTEPIGSVKVLQNNTVQINLMHANGSEDPIHLLLSKDGGRTFEDVELKYSNLILNLEGGKDYILKTKETGTKFNFTITSTHDDVGKVNSTDKLGCSHAGQFYGVGEEFHIGCSELCECTGPETRECVELVCPTHVGIELVSKSCVQWAPSPPPQPPNCCPRSARCLSDGTCHFKGIPVPNWSEVPLSLTGCERRCFCENGELDCQEVCTPLPPVPPQTFRCPPQHRPAAVNISDEDCCKQWGCVPNAENTNGSTLQTYVMPTLGESPVMNYVTPVAPLLVTSSIITTQQTYPTDFYRHLHPVKSYPKLLKSSIPIPVINDPQKHSIESSHYHALRDNITVFTLDDIDSPFKVIQPDPSLGLKSNWELQGRTNNKPVMADSFTKVHAFHSHPKVSPHLVLTTNEMQHDIQTPKNNKAVQSNSLAYDVTAKHYQESPKKVSMTKVDNFNYFLPSYKPRPSVVNPPNFETHAEVEPVQNMQTYFAPEAKNLSSSNYRPHKVFQNSLTYKNKPRDRDTNSPRLQPLTVLRNKQNNIKTNENRDVIWGQDTNSHVLIKAPNPYETVLLRPVSPTDVSSSVYNYGNVKGSRAQTSPLDLEQLVSQMEMESEVNRNLGRSADKIHYNDAAGPTSSQENPPFLPTIRPEIHFPDELPIYDPNNPHRPINPVLPGLPPGLPIAPSHENNKLTVISLQADSPTSVKMLFGLPPVLVGLRGSVDLRYTDKGDEDISQWYSQVFAPADEVLTTPRLEFRLTGLKPSTMYKIKGKLFLHNLPVEPESEIFNVRTQDLPTIMPVEEKRREIDSRLTVVDVNDTAAHVSWRHFTEDELQFIDGIQVRYRPVGTPIYSMTELLHHSRSLAELHDLRPGSRYEASLVLVPPPRATTELHDPGKVEFTTSPYIDPYNWTVAIDAHVVGSEAAELTWRGVPSPAERWVRVYRAAHACGTGTRREHDAFRLATRDLPPTILLTGLEANTRCRVWLELFLSNGKVKTSNVLEINTKPQDTNSVIDNEIEASSIAGSRGSPRGDYYGALVVVGVVAALGALTSLLLLLVLVRRHRPRSVPITSVPSAPRESSLPPYDNPAYKLELQQETMDL